MEEKDIRWVQRFSNYNKALTQFEKFIEKDELNDLEEQGLIKAFEYTYELAWKTLQDILKFKGYENINGPKPVIQQSFQDTYIEDGDGWMKILESRNLSNHTYNEETAEEIIKNIKDLYFDLFIDLRIRLLKELGEDQKKLFNL